MLTKHKLMMVPWLMVRDFRHLVEIWASNGITKENIGKSNYGGSQESISYYWCML